MVIVINHKGHDIVLGKNSVKSRFKVMLFGLVQAYMHTVCHPRCIKVCNKMVTVKFINTRHGVGSEALILKNVSCCKSVSTMVTGVGEAFGVVNAGGSNAISG